MKNDNELIAEFMGCTKPPNPDFDYFWKGEFFKSCNAKWDKSWDWLIAVVEKIEKMGYTFQIKLNEATLYKDNVKGAFVGGVIGVNGKISAVYEMVVEFIKWYNQNK